MAADGAGLIRGKSSCFGGAWAGEEECRRPAEIIMFVHIPGAVPGEFPVAYIPTCLEHGDAVELAMIEHGWTYQAPRAVPIPQWPSAAEELRSTGAQLWELKQTA